MIGFYRNPRNQMVYVSGTAFSPDTDIDVERDGDRFSILNTATMVYEARNVLFSEFRDIDDNAFADADAFEVYANSQLEDTEMVTTKYLNRQFFVREDTQINTSAATSFADGIRHDGVYTAFHNNATYYIEGEIDCSMDATNIDIIVELLVGGTVRRTMRVEMKDSAGGSVNGSGTNQRVSHPVSWIGTLPEGDTPVVLRFRPQQTGVEATIHYSHLRIGRWI